MLSHSPRLQSPLATASGVSLLNGQEVLCTRPMRAVGVLQPGMNVLLSAAYFAIGFTPIAALAISLLGFLPLSIIAPALVLPAVGIGIALGVRFPQHGRLALQGFGIGVLAVALYDGTRMPFIMAGVWGDFIPNIGKWLLASSEPNVLVGYLYRYVGDGGGMGMAFTVAYCLLQPRLGCLRAAIAYGVLIWCCLLLTLLLAPDGQQLMFRLTPTSLGLSLLGHLVYGTAIGAALTWTQLPQRVRRWTAGVGERRSAASA